MEHRQHALGGGGSNDPLQFRLVGHQHAALLVLNAAHVAAGRAQAIVCEGAVAQGLLERADIGHTESDGRVRVQALPGDVEHARGEADDLGNRELQHQTHGDQVDRIAQGIPKCVCAALAGRVVLGRPAVDVDGVGTEDRIRPVTVLDGACPDIRFEAGPGLSTVSRRAGVGTVGLDLLVLADAADHGKHAPGLDLNADHRALATTNAGFHRPASSQALDLLGEFLLGDFLQAGVQSGVDPQAALVYGLIAVLAGEFTQDPVGEVGREQRHNAALLQGLEALLDGHFGGLAAFGFGDEPFLRHGPEHRVSALPAAIRVTVGGIAHRPLGHAREHGGLMKLQVLRGLVVVELCGGLDAKGAVTVADLVQVHLHDLVLGILALHLQGENSFLDLAVPGTFLAEPDVADQLLGDGARALFDVLVAQVNPGGAQHVPGADAPVRVESAILNGDGRLDQLFGHILEFHGLAVFVEHLREQLVALGAVGVDLGGVDLGRQPGAIIPKIVGLGHQVVKLLHGAQDEAGTGKAADNDPCVEVAKEVTDGRYCLLSPTAAHIPALQQKIAGQLYGMRRGAAIARP